MALRVHAFTVCLFKDLNLNFLRRQFSLMKMRFVSKAIVKQYKRCRYWLSQGLRRTTRYRNKAMISSGGGHRTKIDKMFAELNRDKDSLVKRLNAGQELYPNCDTSIWLRSCTHEILSPIQGTVRGNNRHKNIIFRNVLLEAISTD